LNLKKSVKIETEGFLMRATQLKLCTLRTSNHFFLKESKLEAKVRFEKNKPHNNTGSIMAWSRAQPVGNDSWHL
jgi:hypothetical protein